MQNGTAASLPNAVDEVLHACPEAKLPDRTRQARLPTHDNHAVPSATQAGLFTPDGTQMYGSDEARMQAQDDERVLTRAIAELLNDVAQRMHAKEGPYLWLDMNLQQVGTCPM